MIWPLGNTVYTVQIFTWYITWSIMTPSIWTWSSKVVVRCWQIAMHVKRSLFRVPEDKLSANKKVGADWSDACLVGKTWQLFLNLEYLILTKKILACSFPSDYSGFNRKMTLKLNKQMGNPFEKNEQFEIKNISQVFPTGRLPMLITALVSLGISQSLVTTCSALWRRSCPQQWVLSPWHTRRAGVNYAYWREFLALWVANKQIWPFPLP